MIERDKLRTGMMVEAQRPNGSWEPAEVLARVSQRGTHETWQVLIKAARPDGVPRRVLRTLHELRLKPEVRDAL